MGNLAYRLHIAQGLTPRMLGIAAHAETVRIHPFTDGNGRTTRLLANLAVEGGLLLRDRQPLNAEPGERLPD